MLKLFIVIFFLIFIKNVNANNKDKIIENLNKTRNLSFQFEQNINGKIENGDCIIEYPKKISCIYKKKNNKILISNGKSLVIKTNVSYYRYPLKKTVLNLILDKKFLINRIYNLKEKKSNNYIISYSITENDNEIDIFFDKQKFNLIGWQTKDIYQNLSITLLSAIRINQNISSDLFKIPIQN